MLITLQSYDRYFSLSYDDSRRQPDTGSKTGSEPLENSQALGKFLSGVERRAFRRAQIATGDSDEALDIVQDAMFSLAKKYASKTPEDWKLLFQRILSRRIIDWHRHNKVRRRLGIWFGNDDPGHDNSGNEKNRSVIVDAEDEQGRSPEQETETGQAIDKLEGLLQQLPPKQQQVFLLRAWEGLNEKETAKVMACSVGTVKTHYSRARTFLKAKLQEV
tara:strand:- start:195211 stop:195864 length:654 start_codon:yes stop_codon:yes gene_type:complete